MIIRRRATPSVIPAKAGIQPAREARNRWVAAFTGTTLRERGAAALRERAVAALLPLLLLGALLPGCASAQTASGVPQARAALEVPDTLDAYIEHQMRERQIPGLAIAIGRNGEILAQRGYGLASVENQVPVTPQTRFALASLTKQFTAAAIMMLVQEGKLDLNAPITRYLPDAPQNWQPVTSRHLLTHTSGLPPIGEGFSGADAGIYNRIWISTEDAYAAARADTLRWQPGERWAYSDVGFFLAGMIIEQVSGMSWREFMQQRIFEPLGMTETFVLDQIGIHPPKDDGRAHTAYLS